MTRMVRDAYDSNARTIRLSVIFAPVFALAVAMAALVIVALIK
ncbi:hypothetical protein [Nonomuraea endophytica]